jgi:hypothetical protein
VRRAVDRLGVQRRLDQPGHSLVIDAARRAGPHVVVEPHHAALDETRAPLAHCGLGQLHALGDRAVGFTVHAAQDDAGALSDAGSERLRANDISCARSSSVITNSAFGLPLFIALSPVPKYRNRMHYLCQLITGQNTSHNNRYTQLLRRELDLAELI